MSSNPIKESNYIPSFSFLKHLSFRTGGNPEKALHYWLNRGSDYEKEHMGNALEEAIFMPDNEFDIKYQRIDTSFPGENTGSYKFLKAYAVSGDLDQAKEISGIRLKDSTIEEKLLNGWGECIRVINGEFKPLTTPEYDKCMAMRDKVRDHWLFTEHLKGSFLYQQEIKGVHYFEGGEQAYRGFADIIKPHECVVDMKTTSNLNKVYPQLSAGLNHAQLAMYADAEGCNEMAFFAIEMKEPYSCNAFWLSGDKLDEGRNIYENMLEAFYKVNQENLWDKGDDFYYPHGRDFEWER